MVEKEVLISGVGLVTPIGATTESFWHANLAGISGLRSESEMDLSDLPCGWVAGIIGDGLRASVNATWGSQGRSWGATLMNGAVEQAIADARLDRRLSRPAGLIWVKSCPSSGTNPAEFEAHAKRQSAQFRAVGEDFTQTIKYLREETLTSEAAEASSFANEVRARLGVPLIPTRLEATCSGGLRAIAEGARLLQAGRADVAVVASVVSRRTHYVFSQYAQLMAVSRWKGPPEQASMPFDKRRSGMVISEGAGAVILETAEHAKRRGINAVYARLGGWGLAVDTAHVTAPQVELVERVIRAALENSALDPLQVEVVYAHGSSTRLNDITEARALHNVLGAHMREVDVCAVKSLTGHASAASGIIEIIASALTLCEGVVLPVVTCTEPDPDCNVKTNLQPVERPVETVLKNAFGFGGQYASIILQRASSSRRLPMPA